MDRNLTIISLLLQVSPVESPAVPPPQGIARRRGGAVAGSGRGNKTVVKGRGRSASKHIGKGLEAIDLQTNLPCNSLPEPVVASEVLIGTAHKDLCLSKATDLATSLRMVGDTDKIGVPDDDATTSPVPERVWLLFSYVFLYTVCDFVDRSIKCCPLTCYKAYVVLFSLVL